MQEYILTISKKKFYPLNPMAEDIDIKDIAHALSLMTRANGHFKHFYSVAQHSINCCREAAARGYSKKVQLGCLLHDSSEAYIADITRPVKHKLKEYIVVEERLQRLIFEKFGLSDIKDTELQQINEIDDTLLYHEFLHMMDVKLFDKPTFIAMSHDYSQRKFEEVKEEFLDIYESCRCL